METIKRFIAVSAIAAMTAFAGPASANLLISDAGYSGPVLDLSDYANGSYNFTFGPAAITGGITFTSSNDAVLGQGSYGLGNNGIIGGNAVYAGLDASVGWMRFAFSAPVSSFGVYVNYAPSDGAAPMIAAYNQDGILIEEWNLAASAPISSPNGFNVFSFRGIDAEDPDIWSFVLSNAFIVAAGTVDGSLPDNQTNVPEPETLALVALGLLSMGLARRREQAKG